MPFVNEEFPYTDETGHTYNLFRTINHEKNFILRAIRQPGPQDIEHGIERIFEIVWEGERVEMAAKYLAKKKEDGTYDLKWNIHRCGLVRQHLDRRAEFRQLVIEAMECFGVHYGSGGLSSFSLSIDPLIGSLNPEISVKAYMQ